MPEVIGTTTNENSAITITPLETNKPNVDNFANKLFYVEENTKTRISNEVGTYLKLRFLVGVQINGELYGRVSSNNHYVYHKQKIYSFSDKQINADLYYEEFEEIPYTFINNLQIEDVGGGALIGQIGLSGDLVELANRFFDLYVKAVAIRNSINSKETNDCQTISAVLPLFEINFGFKLSFDDEKVDDEKIKFYLDNTQWVSCILTSMPSITFDDILGVSISLNFVNLQDAMLEAISITGDTKVSNNNISMYPHQIIQTFFINNPSQKKILKDKDFQNKIAKASGYGNIDDMLKSENSNSSVKVAGEEVSFMTMAAESGMQLENNQTTDTETKNLLQKIKDSKLVKSILDKITEFINKQISNLMGYLPTSSNINLSSGNLQNAGADEPEKPNEAITKFATSFGKFLEDNKIEILWYNLEDFKNLVIENILRENKNDKKELSFIFDNYEEYQFSLNSLLNAKYNTKKNAVSIYNMLKDIVEKLPHRLYEEKTKDGKKIKVEKKFAVWNITKGDKTIIVIGIAGEVGNTKTSDISFGNSNSSQDNDILNQKFIRAYTYGFSSERLIKSIKFDTSQIGTYFEAGIINLKVNGQNKLYVKDNDGNYIEKGDIEEDDKGGFTAFAKFSNSPMDAPLLKAELEMLGDLSYLSIFENGYSPYVTLIKLDIFQRDGDKSIFSGYYYVTKVVHQISYNSFTTKLSLLSYIPYA